jgi:hypothetical protein
MSLTGFSAAAFTYSSPENLQFSFSHAGNFSSKQFRRAQISAKAQREGN